MTASTPASSTTVRIVSALRPLRILVLLGAVATSVVLLAAGSASAASAGPRWALASVPDPTNFVPGDTEDLYRVTATNVGGSVTNGSTITINDTLPSGLTASEIDGATNIGVGIVPAGDRFTGNPLSCELATLTCTYGGPVDVGDQLAITITVAVDPAASGVLTNQVTVSGGGASLASTSDPTTISATPASFGVDPAGLFVEPSTTTAGAHPDITTFFSFNRKARNTTADSIRDIYTDLPPGLIGNPAALPYCTMADVTTGNCPTDTAVGTLTISLGTFAALPVTVLLYNVAPYADEPAAFAFTVIGVNTRLDAAVIRREGAYTTRITVPAITERQSIYAVSTTFWGVPADHSGPGPYTANVPGGSQSTSFGGPSSEAERLAFLTNPTSCGGDPLTFELSFDSWANPTVPLAYPRQSSAVTGCNQLDFNPTVEAKPTTTVTDSPSGLDFDLHIPQSQDPEGLGTAHLKDAIVTLPPGLVVNPSSANGLGSCSEAQIGFEGGGPNEAPATCPDASKLGTVELETPLLRAPLHGSVYLATPNQNPLDALLAGYILIEGSGIRVKLAGRFSTDPKTGRITASFKQNPQLPFEDFRFHFFGGAGGALRTPSACGTFEATSDLTPWATPEIPDATPASAFALTSSPNGAACSSSDTQLANQPAFTAGTLTPKAGAYSPLLLHLARADGSQPLSSIDTTLPPGLVGRLVGTPYCSEAAIRQAESRNQSGEGALEQASPSCPSASRIGTNTAALGAGPAPFYIDAPVYLAGPYKGAPLSLVTITPALAGPFDLGVVVVRVALHLNPATAQIHAISDPIPTILDGIPLDVRSIAFRIDKPTFTLNPTNCSPMSVTGLATSTLGQAAALSNPFQVGECSALPFGPKLKINLKGATRRTGHPALKATLIEGAAGEANIAHASVALPHSEFLAQNHIGTVCTRVQFDANQCPADSVYGFARAYTPLLDQPLEGPVYLRSNGGERKLPDLVAALRGQIEVDLEGHIDTDKAGGIRTTFESVPDAEVSKFILEMQGGKKGLLVNSENLCAHTNRATAKIEAQNGKTANQSPIVGNSCKGKPKKHGTHHHRAAR